MHKSIVPLLRCPACRNCSATLWLEEFEQGENGHTSDGALICRSCGTWYPIERDVLELVPPEMLYRDDFAAFCAKHRDRLSNLGLGQPGPPDQGRYADQIKQRDHFDCYALNKPEFPDYTLIPFIRATSQRYLRLARETWKDPETLVLDVGCGTGIHSWPLMDACTLVGFDVSKRAVRNATEGARQRGLLKNGSFFVGDGSSLPFAASTFDRILTLGVLHHLPNPEEVVTDIQRVLKPGGVHFAVENNQSAFRKLFDLLMAVWPLWVEEAGSHPLISREMIAGWTRNLPAVVDCQTSVFLPPQLVNLLGRVAVPVVEYSDRFFSKVPVWNQHGGQLVFTIRKVV